MRLAKRFHRPSLLATTTFLVLSLLVNLTSTVNSQVTFLDKLGLPFLRSGREFLFKFAGATGHNEADFRTNLRNNVSLYKCSKLFKYINCLEYPL